MITATMITIPGPQEHEFGQMTLTGFQQDAGWVVEKQLKPRQKETSQFLKPVKFCKRNGCCPPPAIHVFEKISTHDCHFLNNFSSLLKHLINFTTSHSTFPTLAWIFQKFPLMTNGLRFAHDDREMLAITSEEGDVSWYALRPGRKPLVLSEYVFKLSVLRSCPVCVFLLNYN